MPHPQPLTRRHPDQPHPNTPQRPSSRGGSRPRHPRDALPPTPRPALRDHQPRLAGRSVLHQAPRRRSGDPLRSSPPAPLWRPSALPSAPRAARAGARPRPARAHRDQRFTHHLPQICWKNGLFVAEPLLRARVSPWCAPGQGTCWVLTRMRADTLVHRRRRPPRATAAAGSGPTSRWMRLRYVQSPRAARRLCPRSASWPSASPLPHLLPTPRRASHLAQRRCERRPARPRRTTRGTTRAGLLRTQIFWAPWACNREVNRARIKMGESQADSSDASAAPAAPSRRSRGRSRAAEPHASGGRKNRV